MLPTTPKDSHKLKPKVEADKKELELKPSNNPLCLKGPIAKGTVTRKELEKLSDKDWVTVIDPKNDITMVAYILLKGTPEICLWMMSILEARSEALIAKAFFRANKNCWTAWGVAVRSQGRAVVNPLFKILQAKAKARLLKDLFWVRPSGWSVWHNVLRYQQADVVIPMFNWLKVANKEELVSDLFRAQLDGWSSCSIIMRYQSSSVITLVFDWLEIANKAGLITEVLRVMNNEGWSAVHLAALYQPFEVNKVIIRCLGEAVFRKAFERKNIQDKMPSSPDCFDKELLKTYPQGWSGHELLKLNPHLKQSVTLQTLLAAAQQKQEKKEGLIMFTPEDPGSESDEDDKKQEEGKVAPAFNLLEQEPGMEMGADQKDFSLIVMTADQEVKGEFDIEEVVGPASSQSLHPQPQQSLSRVDEFCTLLNTLKENSYKFTLCRDNQKNTLKITLSNRADLAEDEEELRAYTKQLIKGLKAMLSTYKDKIVWGFLSSKGQLKKGDIAIDQQLSDDSIQLYVKDSNMIDQVVSWLVNQELLEQEETQKAIMDCIVL